MTYQAKPREETRIAWLAPLLARGWRWQSLFKEFSALCPNTVIFTGFWPGTTRGFEGAFRIEQVPGVCSVELRSTQTSGDPFLRQDRLRSPLQRSGNRIMWASPRILVHLLRFRPNVILTNGFHLWTLCALLVKAIFNSHLILLWQGVSPETGGENGTLRLKLRRMLAAFFDLAVTNTEVGARYLKEIVGIPAERVKRFVGEVADRSAFVSSRPISFETLARPRFLFVGSLVRGKGVEQLLAASSFLVQQGFKEFSVLVVGYGPARNELHGLARNLGLERQVRWEGFVPYEELGAYYTACDVFVLPSLEDTWGVTALEAMAFAKPVLVSRYAGVSEMVQQGVNGYVFDPLTTHEFAGAMRQFIARPELAAEFGIASATIMARHTPRHVAEELARMALGTLQSGASSEVVLRTVK